MVKRIALPKGVKGCAYEVGMRAFPAVFLTSLEGTKTNWRTTKAKDFATCFVTKSIRKWVGEALEVLGARWPSHSCPDQRLSGAGSNVQNTREMQQQAAIFASKRQAESIVS